MPKILVADDNTNIQRMVALAFEERGIDVISVGNGEAAVRRLPDLMPDMVLADIFMPVRNGYEVCEYVKKDGRFSHIPVILLVGAFDPLDEKEARRVGADGVLKKPFVPPDPLIAMVTAVLEKNPKLAAEMAVARTAAAQAAQAPPVAAVELPAVAPPKPLPHFPEPSPEESALIYGFGSGRRALDDAKDAIPSAEPPVPIADEDEEAAEEFDGAATTRDWRRNAMDFEIPEDAAKQPAFASDENLDAISFPSSGVEEASHVPLSPVQEVTAQPANETDEFESAAGLSHFDDEEPSLPAVGPVSQSASSKPEAGSATPEIRLAASGHFQEIPAIAAEDAPESAHAVEPEIQQHIEEVSVAAHEVTPEPSFASKVRGWMDAISPSGYAEGGWFASLTAAVTGAEKSKSPADPHASAESESHVAPAVSSSSIAGPQAAQSAPDNIAQENARSSGPEASHLESDPVAAGAPSPASRSFEDDFSEESFFADEPAVDAHFVEDSADPEQEHAPAVHAFESDHEFGAEVAAESVSEPAEDLPLSIAGFASGRDESPRAADSVGFYREPDLVEPPAVHVIPDPLLVDDEPGAPSPDYGSRPLEIPAVHDFSAPSPEVPSSEEPVAEAIHHDEPVIAEHAAAELPAEELHAEVLPAEEHSDRELPLTAHEESSSPVSDSLDTSAWTPTALPASRADLAGIPFLTPPREFLARHAETAKAENSATVDAVVQKVLERLEPQLRELLAQGLKPLVENILEGEAEKKHR